MATQPDAKIDAAAEKAYAEASAARKAEAPKSEAAPDPAADVPAPKTPAKAPARKAAVQPKANKPKKKTTVKKTAAKKAPKATVAARRKPAAKAPAKPVSKDTIMTKTKTATTDYAAQMKDGLAELQARAKTAYDKGTEYAAEARDFSQGNLDAMVESGKIFAAGMQDMAKGAMDNGKGAMETMTTDAKDFAAVKSPTDFVELQGKIASRNFDAAVAQMSKATEAWVKLAGDVAAPLSSRMSLAMDRVRKAA
ncbi:phasin family protein [Pelagerythrobacter sp.]|uniref:phasin family protein n=1 Tax=Pelagerythrobacter sp. TaxID=2800702 RepID=UPI0035B32B48